MDKGRILVTGATGYIGGRLVSRLEERGHTLRLLTRNRSRLEGRGWVSEVVEGDVLESETLGPPLEGIQIAYYLVHSMRGGEFGFRERDRIGARNFAAAAASAGVRRIIYLGGLGAGDSTLSEHLSSRQEVGTILAETGVSVTEFRAAIIVGSGSISFEMIRYLTERLPVMIAPRWVNSRCQPIAVRDVLAYLIAALDEPQSADRVIEIGGADVLTYGDMLMQYAEVRGLRRRIIRVPVLTPRLSSYWVDLVTPIPASISRPLIEGLRNDVVVTDPEPARLFDDIDPMTYREAVVEALERVGRRQIETVWSGSQSSVPAGNTDGLTVETREGLILERRQIEIDASASRVFSVVARIGGKRGWYFANALWRLRGALDRLVGGVGFRRGRRDPDDLRPGDALDFWRVEDVEPEAMVRLRAEMKVPGKAWLQFAVEPITKERACLTQTAFFEPRGLLGHLYWYVLYPIHRVIFWGLCRSIKRRSEATQNETSISEKTRLPGDGS